MPLRLLETACYAGLIDLNPMGKPIDKRMSTCHPRRPKQKSTSRIRLSTRPGDFESVERRPIGSEPSRFFRGSVPGAGENSRGERFENSRSITRITITTTIRLTAATGSCCVSTVTKTSTPGIRWRNGMAVRPLATSRRCLPVISRSLLWKIC